MNAIGASVLTLGDNVLHTALAAGTNMVITNPVEPDMVVITTDTLVTAVLAAVARMVCTLITELERQGRACVTRSASRAHGRQEDGTTHPLTSTTMANVIITNIPLRQPEGRLAIPADFWAQFRGFITQLGGDFEYEETRKRGFIFGEEGMQVYQLTITLPDDADVVRSLAMIDSTLKAAIRGHLTPAPALEPV